MRRYRSCNASRLRDILLEEIAGVLDRHAERLATADVEAVADVRLEVDALLMAAERAPATFIGARRKARRRAMAAEARVDA